MLHPVHLQMNQIDPHHHVVDAKSLMHNRTVLPSFSRQDLNNKSLEYDSKNLHSNSCTPTSFPQILRDILSDQSNSNSITWLPHGRAFLILDRKILVEQILPRYLGKATKYTSFTRKLSRWNFSRVPSGPDEGAWYHKNFFRDDSTNKHNMKCSNRRNSNELVQEFPRTKPLKKRPVDASLFSLIDRPTKNEQKLIEKSKIEPIITSSSAFMCARGYRPLGIADTPSIIQAAIEALARSDLGNSTSSVLTKPSHNVTASLPWVQRWN